MAKSKKLTAVVAIGCAAVMTLSGTFAWILQQDETKLNSFSHAIPDYGVEIEEDFEAWVNKDVTVKATGTNEVIVRARFEEFLSIDGKTTDVAQQSGIYTATALADAVNPNGNDIRKDASKLNPQIVDLYFGEKFITMAEWTAMTTGVTGTALVDLYEQGWWVIDTDGWCYYTKSLGNFEESNLSLSNALLNLTDSELKEDYGAPVNLDYNINVRVQAISADLSDYGATDNPSQWTCATTGRVIEDDPNVVNEITTDTPVTAGANTLITRVAENSNAVEINGYSVSLKGTTKTATINGFSASTTALTQVDGYDAESATLTFPTTITYDEEEYQVTSIGEYSFMESTLLNGVSIVLPQNLQKVSNRAFSGTKIAGEVVFPESVSYIGEQSFKYTDITSIVFAGKNGTDTPMYVVGEEYEADTLTFVGSCFSYARNITFPTRLPQRTTYMGWYIFYSSSIPNVEYPSTTVLATGSGGTFGYFSGGRAAYTVPVEEE